MTGLQSHSQSPGGCQPAATQASLAMTKVGRLRCSAAMVARPASPRSGHRPGHLNGLISWDQKSLFFLALAAAACLAAACCCKLACAAAAGDCVLPADEAAALVVLAGAAVVTGVVVVAVAGVVDTWAGELVEAAAVVAAGAVVVAAGTVVAVTAVLGVPVVVAGVLEADVEDVDVIGVTLPAGTRLFGAAVLGRAPIIA